MKIEVHVHHHHDWQLTETLGEILRGITALRAQGVNMEQLMRDLEAAVTKNSDAVESAVILVNGIAARIESAAGDKVKLAALVAELHSDAQTLADAVVANTPAAEE